MKELSRRELSLLLIVPGLLIIGVYYFVFDSSAASIVKQKRQSVEVLNRSIDGLDQSIAAVKKLPVPQVALAQQEADLLSRQVDAEKRWVETNAHPWRMLPVRWTTAAGRIDALRTVASIFEANGLVVLSREVESGSKNVVPKELEDFATAVQNDGNHPVPEVWRIEVIGTYQDMLAALKQVGQSDAFIIPLAVSMEVLPGQAAGRSWTLWLWV